MIRGSRAFRHCQHSTSLEGRLYTHYTVSSEVRDLLNDLEAELERPIRIVNGTMQFEQAWDGYISHDSSTYAVGDPERGVTVVRPTRGEYTTHAHYVADQGCFTPTDEIAAQFIHTIEYDGVTVAGITAPCQVVFLPCDDATYNDGWPVGSLIEAIQLAASDDLIATYAASAAERTERALRIFATTLYTSETRRVRNEIDAHQSTIAAHRAEMATCFRLMREKQLVLDTMLSLAGTNGAEKVLHDWELLKAHPRIAELSFTGSTISVLTTDDLRITRPDTGESRWLGQFSVKINLTNSEITMRNLSTPRGGRDHPHVVANRPCFGGHQNEMHEILGRGELFLTFELCIQYLETLNLSDEYGRYGSYWFDVEDQRPIIEEALAA